MTKVHLRPRLDDWPRLKALWKEFKESPEGAYIEGDLAVFEAFFLAACQGVLEIGLLLLEVDGELRGFALMNQMVCTNVVQGPHGPVLGLQPHGFVRGVHVKRGTPLCATVAMEQAMTEWSRSRGHKFITGYCRHDLSFKGMSRWGWEPQFQVVVKRL